MNIFQKFALIVSMVAASIATPAAAQQSPLTLDGDVKVVKEVTDENGATRTELLPPDVVVPGDKLLFTTTYRNGGTEPVENFVATNPVPAAVAVHASADPALVVSVDGGTTWGVLADLTTTGEDGSSRPARHDDITHIRWTLARVEPGASGELQYPAIIR